MINSQASSATNRGDWSKSQFARRQRIEFAAGLFGYVAAPEDIILGKLIYYNEGRSEKHLRDIRGILKVSAAEIDMAYLTATANDLGVAELWQALQSES